MILDVTDATFESEVLQRSMTTPVVVDLWAPWCGPCKTLTPIIEKVVTGTGGKVALAKINVDENPQTSAAFRVQSIPAVFALDQGEIVANFMGAQPEPQVREFVNGLIGDAVVAEIHELLARGDEPSLRRALELEVGNLPATVMLGQLLITEGRMPEALEVLEAGPRDDENVAALLEMARNSALPPDAQSEIEARLAALLSTVKGDDDARGEFLTLLEELSVGNPGSAADWRKKLSTALF